MLKYKRTLSKNNKGEEIYKYFKDGNPTRAITVPPEVIEKLEGGFPEVIFEDEPERRRCIFCDGPQKRVRVLNMVMVDLCEWHYQHMNLGKVAAQVRVVEKEIAAEQAKAQRAEPVTKKVKKTKKTALSSMVD